MKKILHIRIMVKKTIIFLDLLSSFSFQNMSKDVSSRKPDVEQLTRELEVAEQASSSLQKNFQEYCPDIRHQESDVKRLRNRYATIPNQLQLR